MKKNTAAEFWANTDQGPVPPTRPELGPCLLWTSTISKRGYGQINFDGKLRRAHRVAWYLVHGDWPTDTINHRCHVRHCVNVGHLEDVTMLANNRDHPQAQRTHCPQGHPYDEANTYVTPSGSRSCKECNRTLARERYRRLHPGAVERGNYKRR